MADVDGKTHTMRADPEWKYCGYCEHHTRHHDYPRPGDNVVDPTTPCTECPDGVCVRYTAPVVTVAPEASHPEPVVTAAPKANDPDPRWPGLTAGDVAWVQRHLDLAASRG